MIGRVTEVEESEGYRTSITTTIFEVRRRVRTVVPLIDRQPLLCGTLDCSWCVSNSCSTPCPTLELTGVPDQPLFCEAGMCSCYPRDRRLRCPRREPGETDDEGSSNESTCANVGSDDDDED